MTPQTFIVATNKEWHIDLFNSKLVHQPGNWLLVQKSDELKFELIKELQPRYIFFPHWGKRVPAEILQTCDCVCFHETDLPFGRGGSPIQNLIARGYKETMISALRMEEELDAGPIYSKQPLALNGSALEIFQRSAGIMVDMILDIIERQPEPLEQEGKSLVFTRRKPEQSRINRSIQTSKQLYDHIRMLDAPGYPKAFIEIGNLRLEFSEAELTRSGLDAKVKVLNN